MHFPDLIGKGLRELSIQSLISLTVISSWAYFGSDSELRPLRLSQELNTR